MRGQLTLSNALKDTTGGVHASGTKAFFSRKRDECLMYRFYHRFNVLQRRYDVTVAELAREFFISETTVINRLTENAEQLKTIELQNPSTKDLRKRYPHLIW